MTLAETVATADLPSDALPRATTPLPPWTVPGAAAGSGRLTRPLPEDVVAAFAEAPEAHERLALAAWLAVLARCVGEADVCTAVAGTSGELRAVTADVTGKTWREVPEGLTRTPVAGYPASALDLSGDLPSDAASLIVGITRGGAEIVLRYDLGVVCAAAAERLAGYLEFALVAAVAGPGTPVDLAGMLGERELHRQLVELCGPRVNCGPDGFVAAFRARVALGPQRRAASHRDRTLSYAELDRESDRLARHLRGRGIGTGDTVAVISDRGLLWVVALVGVLKAGAIYLPVRPDFPPARVEDQLGQAACRVALTGPGADALASELVDRGVWTGDLQDLATLPDGDDAGVPLPDPDPADRAYVYFTSGSTGRPKGAVCAHAGMINHLWAKVDDHDLGPDDVVTQTASQCFDISLWQVCAPLLVGGETVVVDVDDQLNVAAFAALMDRHGVTTVQIVPSYLEVLLAHLETGAVRLPRLSSVSVTGEALNAELVRRWFAVVPDVKLVNAYGATEVSDDTMHAVLTRPPVRDLAVVDVGRPLRNMRVYVVDAHQRLMPEGARGEIVFAGVCVGNGYLNDPVRTAEAFGPDPYVPGERLYRSGDLGRWLPEGTIEFLGRRDEQVKIRGLRVEIGEVQAVLLSIPGVEAAAVLRTGAGNAARLVGFYVVDHDLTSVDLYDLLAARLPDYMVPAHLFRLPELPLNDNGKTDKRRLALLAEELSAGLHPFEPPVSATEQQLATIWAEVLGLAEGRIGRRDAFFDLGGTSLSAIHLLMRLDHRLSLADLVGNPVLADQADLLDARTGDTGTALVQELGGEGTLLVCFPDAGGNAINFHGLAAAAGARVRVAAVEPPGHDLARRDEELLPVTRLAEAVAGELRGHEGPVHLWGQGAGAVAARSTAAALERAGVIPGGVVLCWDDSVPTDPAGLSDEQVADRLRDREAYVDVAGSTPGRLEFVARAYRHDWSEALAVMDTPEPLTCPVLELTLTGGVPRPAAGDAQGGHEPVPDAAGDLARTHPDLVLRTLARLTASGAEPPASATA